MKRVFAFWDASAFVPVCVREDVSRQARAYLREFSPVVWWGTRVEIRGAICRAAREHRVSADAKNGALERLHELMRGCHEILPESELRDLAMRLLDAFPLRAADSLQAAAAMTWCDQRPARRPFVSADRRLSACARTLGFKVLEL